MTQVQLMCYSMRTQKPKAGADWFRIIEDKKSTSAKVYIYDEIGYWGTTAKDFAAQLGEVDADTIELHLNSPGGSVFDGLAIMAALRDHKASVTAYVDGMAASAASFILQAADERIIGRNAQIMIHDAKAYAGGNAQQMRKAADLLDRVSDNIADIYAVRSGQGTIQSWRAIMVAGDEWYNGNEALDAGLVDTVLDNPEEDDDEPEEAKNVFSAEEVEAFLKTPVEKLAASASRLTITNRVEEAHMTGPNPQSPQQPAVPAPPAPVAPVAPVATLASFPEALQGFVVTNDSGEAVLDMQAVVAELTKLQTFKQETIEASRKDFVKELVNSGKILADDESVKNAEEFALALESAQFTQWKNTMSSAPSNPLFAQHGSTGGQTGPQSTPTAATAALAREISDLEEIVQGHRDSGVSEEDLKKKKSYTDLAAAIAKRDGNKS